MFVFKKQQPNIPRRDDAPILKKEAFMPSVVYQSKSGHSFIFNAYDFYNTAWYYDVSGVYIFAKYDRLSNSWQCIYIGETDSFGRRMPEHRQDKWPEALSWGAHAVLAAVIPREWDRMVLEKELINSYPTVLNKKDNPIKLGLGGILRSNEQHRGLADLVRDNQQLQQGYGLLSTLYRL
ncbi:GIY-YIG nuclease family protein [Methylomonas sp. ZR1]|nr:GIY-YIG nuclease family protein [Methylomonas sp. ZR1]